MHVAKFLLIQRFWSTKLENIFEFDSACPVFIHSRLQGQNLQCMRCRIEHTLCLSNGLLHVYVVSSWAKEKTHYTNIWRAIEKNWNKAEPECLTFRKRNMSRSLHQADILCLLLIPLICVCFTAPFLTWDNRMHFWLILWNRG